MYSRSISMAKAALLILLLPLAACSSATPPTAAPAVEVAAGSPVGSNVIAEPSETPTAEPTKTATPEGPDTPTPAPTLEALMGQMVFSSGRADIDEDGDIDNFDGAQLYVLDLASSETSQLTSASYHDASPAWSPNGEHIAFVSDRDGNLELYMMNADGTGIIRLTDSVEDEGHPSWSPDGNQIVFDRLQILPNWEYSSHLYIVSLSGLLAK